VPIGRAAAQTAVGTLIGAAAGAELIAYTTFDSPVAALALAVLGFSIAAVRLRLTYRVARPDTALSDA
jgi:hypothetical protein